VAALELGDHVRRLLVRGLRARRHEAAVFGPGQAAQSPIAKMASSRVVCSVGRTTSWLMRFVSSPPRSFSRRRP
jgi:hypothetical protein